MMHYERVSILAGLTTLAGCGVGDGPPASREVRAEVWREGPRLPAPVANNAVAAVSGQGGISVLSFLGIDSTKVWSGVTNAAYRWDFGGDEGWREIEPLPGPGRLAATVQVVGGRVFVFGGDTVAEDGSEKSTPDVAVYEPRLLHSLRLLLAPRPCHGSGALLERCLHRHRARSADRRSLGRFLEDTLSWRRPFRSPGLAGCLLRGGSSRTLDGPVGSDPSRATAGDQ